MFQRLADFNFFFSSWIDFEDIHFPGAHVEFEGPKNGVGLLVLGDSHVEVGFLLIMLSHLGNVLHFPEHDNTVT